MDESKQLSSRRSVSAVAARILGTSASTSSLSSAPSDSPRSTEIYFRAGYQAYLPHTPAPDQLQPSNELTPSPFVKPVAEYLPAASAGAAPALALSGGVAAAPVVVPTPPVQTYSGLTPAFIVQHLVQQQQASGKQPPQTAAGRRAKSAAVRPALSATEDESVQSARAPTSYSAARPMASIVPSKSMCVVEGSCRLVRVLHGDSRRMASTCCAAAPMEFLPKHSANELEDFILSTVQTTALLAWFSSTDGCRAFLLVFLTDIPRLNQGGMFRQSRKDRYQNAACLLPARCVGVCSCVFLCVALARRLRATDPADDKLRQFASKVQPASLTRLTLASYLLVSHFVFSFQSPFEELPPVEDPVT
jgi:hypothetical protein